MHRSSRKWPGLTRALERPVSTLWPLSTYSVTAAKNDGEIDENANNGAKTQLSTFSGVGEPGFALRLSFFMLFADPRAHCVSPWRGVLRCQLQASYKSRP